MTYCHERGDDHDFDTERGRMNAARHCRKCQAISLDWDDVPHYHAGHNIPGYLPMSDDAPYPADWEGARAELLDDLERYADHIADMVADDPTSTRFASLMASVESAIAEVRTADEEKDGAICVNVCSDDAHDLGESYWVQECFENCAEVEE